MRAFDLEAYDGVLAFGETLAEVYRRWGWGDRVFVWHEAADVELFKPPAQERRREGLVWIGNWGDGERTAELEDYLMAPATRAGLPLDVYGVRYPEDALAMLARYGARYRGWLANARAPEVFARHLATVHVPRRFYVERLPGIPTIRVFEALACGIPLVSAPWRNSENLFTSRRGFPLSPATARRWQRTYGASPQIPSFAHCARRTRACNDPRPSHLRASRRRIARHSRRASARAVRAPRHEASVLRLQPALRPTGTARRPIIAGSCASSRSAAGISRSTNPTLTIGSSHRDIEPPEYARVVVWPADAAGVTRVVAEAAEADVVVKASGVGVFDDALLDGLIAAAATRRAAGVLGR